MQNLALQSASWHSLTQTVLTGVKRAHILCSELCELMKSSGIGNIVQHRQHLGSIADCMVQPLQAIALLVGVLHRLVRGQVGALQAKKLPLLQALLKSRTCTQPHTLIDDCSMF